MYPAVQVIYNRIRTLRYFELPIIIIRTAPGRILFYEFLLFFLRGGSVWRAKITDVRSLSKNVARMSSRFCDRMQLLIAFEDNVTEKRNKYDDCEGVLL